MDWYIALFVSFSAGWITLSQVQIYYAEKRYEIAMNLREDEIKTNHELYEDLKTKVENLTEVMKTHIQSRSAEVLFLIDSFLFVHREMMNGSVFPFVRSIPKFFGKNWKRHRYGIITFNEELTTQMAPAYVEDMSSIENKIQDMVKNNASEHFSNVVKALKSIHDRNVFKSTGPDIARILFIIADGEKGNTGDIEYEAKKLKTGTRVHIFGIVAETNYLNSEVMKTISSGPTENFHFNISDYTIQKIASTINMILTGNI